MQARSTEENLTSTPTDKGGKKFGGKGAKERRNENYRKFKNQETDNVIMAGIFSRLKISDPTAVPSLPLARDLHPVTVPVTFKRVPTYVDRVWDTMEAIGTRPFAQLNTAVNKAIFKKGMLILSEAKVCYAQRAHMDKPDEELPSKRMYTLEELHDLNEMASVLPYPLAIYLESIGNTMSGRQIVTPLIAEIRGNEAMSGAITYSPRQLLSLLRLLRDGVPEDQEVHNIAIGLNDLPGLVWEQFEGPIVAPNVAGPRMVRLNAASADFWLQNDHIKWSNHEYQVFVKIVQSMGSKKGFNIMTDLSPGYGSLAQVVQTPLWTVGESCQWYTMDDIDEYNQKLGVAFGFGSFDDHNVQPSRFIGSYTTSYWRGELTPRRVMHAIVAGQE